MKVKIVNPEHAAGMLDPQTLRSPFIDPGTNAVVETADVPENTFWTRRIRSGELVRIADEPSMPRGNEPVAPITTRGGK